MSLRFYMDVHIPHAVTLQLRHRGMDVLTSQEDGTQRLDDSKLLDRASSLGRVLVTQDDDLLREAALRRNREQTFVGVVYASAIRVTLGEMVRSSYPVFRTRKIGLAGVEYLPLK